MHLYWQDKSHHLRKENLCRGRNCLELVKVFVLGRGQKKMRKGIGSRLPVTLCAGTVRTLIKLQVWIFFSPLENGKRGMGLVLLTISPPHINVDDFCEKAHWFKNILIAETIHWKLKRKGRLLFLSLLFCSTFKFFSGNFLNEILLIYLFNIYHIY